MLSQDGDKRSKGQAIPAVPGLHPSIHQGSGTPTACKWPFIGEIQLTDASAMLMEVERMTASRVVGKGFDCGAKLGYLQATVEYVLNHPQLGEAFRKCLETIQNANERSSAAAGGD